MKNNKPLKQVEFDNNIYDTIRKNIKKYRKQRNMTAQQLADMVELSHDFIRQIESEKAAYNFSVDTFYRISVALGVKLDKLIEKQKDDANNENEPTKYEVTPRS